MRNLNAVKRKKIFPHSFLDTNLFDEHNMPKSPPKYSKSNKRRPQSRFDPRKLKSPLPNDPISKGVGKKIEVNNPRWGDYSKVVSQYERAF